MRYPTDAVTRSLAVLVIFTAFGADLWRNLIGWWGYLAVAAVLTVLAAVLLTRRRLWGRLALRRLPRTLLLFGLLLVASLAWSFYPGATVLGLIAQAATTLCALFLAAALSWPQLVAAASTALTWILGLSLVFEFVVAVFVRAPVLPFFTDYSGQKVPDAFYWSQADLFHGGPIQGVLGNRNLLAFVAVLALVLLVLQLAQGLRRRRPAIAWIVVALVTLALTRSATAIGALVITTAMLGVLLLARRVGPGRRVWLLVGVAGATALAGVLVSTFWAGILSLFGKSEDLTGRLDIWSAVSSLIAERPAFGWGWVSYWAPWVEPFDGLAERKGVVYLQAHDAWLDVWLQVGLVGLVIFAGLVVATFYRSWWFAVDHPLDGGGRPLPRVAITLAPALLLTALLAQSVVESRMLVEGGWLLLILIAVKTKLDLGQVAQDLGTEPPRRPERAAAGSGRR